MKLLLAFLLSTGQEAAAFPERVPGMIEACLLEAIETGAVSEADDSFKYMCAAEPARRLWTYLEDARVASWEQDAGDEGHWLTREFPLGGCFKRLRNADGSAATGGLSCSIWIPRPKTEGSSASGAAGPPPSD